MDSLFQTLKLCFKQCWDVASCYTLAHSFDMCGLVLVYCELTSRTLDWYVHLSVLSLILSLHAGTMMSYALTFGEILRLRRRGRLEMDIVSWIDVKSFVLFWRWFLPLPICNSCAVELILGRVACVLLAPGAWISHVPCAPRKWWFLYDPDSTTVKRGQRMLLSFLPFRLLVGTHRKICLYLVTFRLPQLGLTMHRALSGWLSCGLNDNPLCLDCVLPWGFHLLPQEALACCPTCWQRWE